MNNAQKEAPRGRVDIHKATLVDVILIVIIILVAGGLIIKTKFGLQSSKATEASIYHDGKLFERLSLDKNQERVLLNGKMIVEVRDKRIRVKQSDCPRKICVTTGWIRHAGEAIVCVPFKTLIEIKSSTAPLVDAVVF
ncbi:MAG: NusG domain II-containing protein [Desulfobacterales bacterium]|nr:NusG domain II-containing protein [Desulfobacterales bacterium]